MLPHVGQTQRMTGYSDCRHPSSREALSNRPARHADAARPDPKHRSYDIGCGFVRFCHKHIFANPTATSSISRHTGKVSENNRGSVVPGHSYSQCDSVNAHFNPCYIHSSPPDDDDDVDISLDAASLTDSLCSTHTRKTHALPTVSEMSESCFEGLQSSTRGQIIDLPRQFRPVSWAGSVDDCLIGSGCHCSNQSACCTLKSDTRCLLENSELQTASGELCAPLSAETPFYWELELPSKNDSTSLASQTSLVPEICQKLASPLQMGTLSFNTGNVLESSNAHAASKLMPNKQSYQNSGSILDTMKAPKMGGSPARCFVCRDCRRVCSPSAVSRHMPAVSNILSPLPHEIHIPRPCKCVKQRRCPTPPRMLSPCVDDDSVRVPVADI